MSRELVFHPLVQKDLNEIIAYYEDEASSEIADLFEAEVRAALLLIQANPLHYPFYLKQGIFRRFTLRTFPHLILFVVTKEAIRIMVLKHVKRSSKFGLKRR